MSYLKVFSVLCLGLLLFGCASAPSTTEASTAPQTSTPAQTMQTTPSTSVPASTDSSDFTALMEKAASVKYKAFYETTAVAQGQSVTMTSIEAVSGTKMKIEQDVQGQKTWTFFLDGKVYICMNTGTLVCFESPSASTQTMDQQVQKNPAEYTITQKPSRTIAGVVGSCFGLSSPQVTGEVESCYSKEGVLLYMKTADGSFTKIATAVNFGAVPESEFSLPAVPTTLPTMPS